MALTDTRIRKARVARKPYKLTDGGSLYLEVRTTGAKLWRFRYRVGGSENVFAIGAYPEIGLRDAREARDAARKLVKQGVHPAQRRQLERLQQVHEGANTFAAIAHEWLDQNAAHWTPRTKRQRERLLERAVFPHIGELPIKKVTPAHVLAILKRLEKKAPSFALLAQQAISATFRLAIATLRAESDPVPALRDSIKTPPTKHKTPLREQEIPGFFAKLDAFPGGFPTKAAIRLLWWTLIRTNEALGATWSEFDLDRAEWRIPGKRMKKRTITDHVVPLPIQAVVMLRTLHGVTGNSEYLFPSRSSLKQPVSIGILWKAVAEGMGYSGKFSPHGIRATGSTMLNEMGFDGDWVERQLAHIDRNETRASYNGAKYLDQRRNMVQQWADYLDALCSGSKVTPIRRAAIKKIS